MIKRMLAIAIVLAAALLSSFVLAADKPAPATIVVNLPADAKLSFDDTATEQVGSTRQFITPPLNPKKQYGYLVSMELDVDGKLVKKIKDVDVRAGEIVKISFDALDDAAADEPAPAASPEDEDGGWPRTVTAGNMTVTIYQPQVEQWETNRLRARAAVSVEKKGDAQPTFGVIWLTALTDVDKESRRVALLDCKVEKAQFPSAPKKTDEYLALLGKHVPQEVQTIALDRLEASLAANPGDGKGGSVEVKNDPPAVLWTKKPALLVLIDGAPVFRPVEGSQLVRALNTRALIFHDQTAGKYYLRAANRWLETGDLEKAVWTEAPNPPDVADATMRRLQKDTQIDWLNQVAGDLKEVFDSGKVPPIYIRTEATELIETVGEPELAAIEGTKLQWVKNTPNQLLFDSTEQDYFALFSGRWFRSKGLAGPWEFVAANKLPADFAQIPPDHPRGDVLSSVAGTPQAEAALVASRIPQTAVIKCSEASLDPVFDGDPQFEPIDGTSLRYAVNSPTPVIEVDTNNYFAIENGVWFTATTPKGNWVVAKTVPPAIYRIPVRSPIHYVTYAYTYYYNPVLDYVYVGYTPGYFGVYLNPWGTLVYGTGWWYRPWIRLHWWGMPWTYGWAVRFGWTPAGWAFGFGNGGGWVWWGPLGWHWGWLARHELAKGLRPGWHTGWGGPYANIHINNLNFGNVNIYHRWPEKAHVVTQTHVATTSHHGDNNTIAGHDGNIYRRGEKGWEVHTAQGWKPYDPNHSTSATKPDLKKMEKDLAARHTGEANANRYKSSGTGSSANQSHTMPKGAAPPTGKGVSQPKVAPPAPRPAPPAAHRVAPPVHHAVGGFHGSPGGFRSFHGYGGLRVHR